MLIVQTKFKLKIISVSEGLPGWRIVNVVVVLVAATFADRSDN